MNSNLCLAQAQYLFFKKASDANMAPKILAKVAAQVSMYFQKAFECNQVNQQLRAYQNGTFANVLGYHSKYFMAQAYLNLTRATFDAADKAGKGMGLAAAYGKITLAEFEKARPFVNILGGAYKQNFDKKFAEAQELAGKAENENKTIYYEGNIDPSECAKPDPQNFVNLSSVAEELNKTPELDNKFRHLVPPAVRQMQDELKNVLQ